MTENPTPHHFAIVGAGRMAFGVVHHLLRASGDAVITLVDASSEALDAHRARWGDEPRINYVHARVGEPEVDAVIAEATCLISAAHYDLNEQLTRRCIEHGTHMVDMGGNNDVVAAQLAMHAEAEAAGVSIIPDLGLAPGLASALVAFMLGDAPWADTVRIGVGGLPETPVEPFRYERLFNVEGLINEYVETPIGLVDGSIRTLEPLGDVRTLEIDGVGTLEAFNTAGGVSTLPHTYIDRLNNISYQTLRYPGHAHAMRWLLELGLMDSSPITVNGSSVVPRELLAQAIDAHVPAGTRDRTVVVVDVEGGENHSQLVIDDAPDDAAGLSSMMRTTSYPAAIASMLQADGAIAPGVVPIERAVDAVAFVDAVRGSGIDVRVRQLQPA